MVTHYFLPPVPGDTAVGAVKSTAGRTGQSPRRLASPSCDHEAAPDPDHWHSHSASANVLFSTLPLRVQAHPPTAPTRITHSRLHRAPGECKRTRPPHLAESPILTRAGRRASGKVETREGRRRGDDREEDAYGGARSSRGATPSLRTPPRFAQVRPSSATGGITAGLKHGNPGGSLISEDRAGPRLPTSRQPAR
jgi:hypothetical protein